MSINREQSKALALADSVLKDKKRRTSEPKSPFATAFSNYAWAAMNAAARRGRAKREANKPVYDVNGRRVQKEAS